MFYGSGFRVRIRSISRNIQISQRKEKRGNRTAVFRSKQRHLEPEGTDSFIALNPKTGLLEDPLVGLRVLAIDTDFYKGLKTNLYARFQSGASLILYEMGVGYGELMAKNIKGMGSGRIEVYKRFMERGKHQGYGEFKVPILQAIISGLKGEAKIYLKDSFFAASAGNTGKVECWIVAGMIAGAARKILDKEVTCVEELCISKGDDHCEFRLKS
jgi:predicted hydrocarbon binding protein